jgi:hypothetical protein
VALVLALLTLFALRPISIPPLSDAPTTFDGQRAMGDLRKLAEGYPKRAAGSDAANRAAIWLAERIKDIGLEPHIEGFVTRIDGENTALQNVWAVSKGETSESILLIADRESPPLSTQGANDNASGVAMLLELARVFTLQSHDRSIVFLWTDGDAYGAVGARQFLAAHLDMRMTSVLSVRRVATARPRSIRLDGWSDSDQVTPAWFWALASSAGTTEAKLRTPVPFVLTQLVRLSMPVGGGSQAPFVALGLPALSISAQGDLQQPQNDTVGSVSADALGRVGRAVERMVATLDGDATPRPGSSSSVFFSRSRALPGPAVQLAIFFLIAPLALVTVDLYAASRRRRRRLGPAWLLYVVRFAPWCAMLVFVYFLNLVGLLPRSPGGGFPPDALVSQSPRYLRAFLLLLLFGAVVWYGHAVERRLSRRGPVAREATVTVLHIALCAVALLMLWVNPFSLLLVLPAALLWPLARYGPWPLSRLPAWGGLTFLAVALLYYGLRLGLGWRVWWYFFLLLENRTVPVSVALLVAAFVAAAVHLGHHLHRAAGPRRRQTRRRRNPRPTAAQGPASSGVP